MAETVINKVVQQMEILNLAGSADMDSGAGALVELIANGDMVVICVSDGEIRINDAVNFLLQLGDAEFRFFVREADYEAVAHIIVSATGKIISGHTKFTKILSCMGHKPVVEGLVDRITDLLRLGTKKGRTGN